MYLDEFTDIFVECDLSTDHFGTREINIVFVLSQQTEVFELETIKQLQMCLVEFLEALA